MSESNKNIYVLDKEKKDTAGAIRKMAAIFAADVVGYSKLMASNEKLTLFRLKETRKITDKSVSIIGSTKKIEILSAKGIYFTAMKKQKVVRHIASALITCNPKYSNVNFN